MAVTTPVPPSWTLGLLESTSEVVRFSIDLEQALKPLIVQALE